MTRRGRLMLFAVAGTVLGAVLLVGFAKLPAFEAAALPFPGALKSWKDQFGR